VLATYVRERKRLSMPNAIAKMTGRSAQQVGLVDRGVLAVGKKADITVFDPALIADRGTFQEPALPPAGVLYVLVNGEVVLDSGSLTDARAGRGLRRAQWTSSEGASR
jgi:N-acyl-D-aspartate/D-glutamate deacylase